MDNINTYNEEESKKVCERFEKESKKYQEKYDENKFLNKITDYGKKIGVTPIYLVFLLYHSMKSKQISTFAKAPIAGAIAYFVSFVDFLPDITPFVGYCDDVTIIVGSLAVIASQITDEIREQAKESTRKIFPNVTDEEFSIIDDMYKKGAQNVNEYQRHKTDTRDVEVEIVDPDEFKKKSFFKWK